jgi:hypothetical protein
MFGDRAADFCVCYHSELTLQHFTLSLSLSRERGGERERDEATATVANTRPTTPYIHTYKTYNINTYIQDQRRAHNTPSLLPYSTILSTVIYIPCLVLSSLALLHPMPLQLRGVDKVSVFKNSEVRGEHPLSPPLTSSHLLSPPLTSFHLCIPSEVNFF